MQMFDMLGLRSRPAFLNYAAGNESSRDFSAEAQPGGGCGGNGSCGGTGGCGGHKHEHGEEHAHGSCGGHKHEQAHA